MSGSKRWIQEHIRDPYVKQAKQAGYVSRAAYKLLEIQKRDKIICPGMVVLDLGASPGGWSQVASKIVGSSGMVIAVDILPMDPLPGVRFVQGDIHDPNLFAQLTTCISKIHPDAKIDLVISDMAPNISGIKAIDQPCSLNLVELAWDIAKCLLKPGGAFLAKIFQGPGVDGLLQEMRKDCRIVKLRKPKSSRAKSREVYILAIDFIGYNRSTSE